MAHLALVTGLETQDAAFFDVLLLGGDTPRMTPASSRDVPQPQISLSLHTHYVGTGHAIEVNGGMLAEVSFSILRAGRMCAVLGIAVPLLRGTELVFPLGFFGERGEQRLHAA